MASSTVSAGGLAYAPPFGQEDTLSFTNNAWNYPGSYSINFTTTTTNATLGLGLLAGLTPLTTPICGLTLANRVYLGAGQEYLFSNNGDPTGWEQQDVGAGFVGLITQYGIQDNVLGLASYQGRLAVYGRYSTQVWIVNADPLQFTWVQTLANTGTRSMLSVQSLGDSDVIALADFGFWSLRVRDSSLNATTIDIGSAISPIVQPILQATPTAGSNACGIVDPQTNRYWCFLQDTIYVLSYFPSAKIEAWSTYKPTDNSGATFVPSKFVVYNGQVYCRGTVAGTDYLFQYGGTNNLQFDNTTATVKIPWTAGYGKTRTPATIKQYTQADFIMKGAWDLYASADYYNDALTSFQQLTSQQSVPTTELQAFPFNAQGTHFCFVAKTSDQGLAGVIPTLSSLIVHFNQGAEK